MTESDSSGKYLPRFCELLIGLLFCLALIMRQLHALESEEKARHLAVLSALQSVQSSLNYSSHHNKDIRSKRVKLDDKVARNLQLQVNDSSSATIKSEAGQEISSKFQTASSIALNLAQRLLGETSNRQMFKTLQLLLTPELLKKARAQVTLKEVMSVSGLGLQKLFTSTEL